MTNMNQQFEQSIANGLQSLGVRKGGVLMVHSSLKALGHVPGGAETVIRGILKAIGGDGTLLMPALSYESVTPEQSVFDIAKTLSCVGAIPEYFRKREGTIRSMHPTHSVCGVGPKAQKILEKHILDTTPCGSNSPFSQLRNLNGQILMLGCGLKPNTSMHGIEELVNPEYLWGPEVEHTLIDGKGNQAVKTYRRHGFYGWIQRYDKVERIKQGLRQGKVLNAHSYLIEAPELWSRAHTQMKNEPLYFVDKEVK